jgi:hypothetical protein
MAGTSTATEIYTKFDSTGELKATVGTLKLAGGGKSSNAVSIGDTAKLQISNTYSFEDVTLSVTGSGLIELNGGTTTFKNASGNAKVSAAGGNLDFKDTASGFGSLVLSNGNVTSTGAGSAETGSLTWTGGNVNGKVKSTSDASITGAAKTIGAAGELTLAGTTNTVTAELTNHGKFIKEGTSTTQVSAGLVNSDSGTISVGSGKLNLTAGAQNQGKGKIDVAAGAELEMSGNTSLGSASELKGNGLARFLNGTLIAEGLVAIGTFNFDGGTLAGSNSFSGSVNWNGGDWSAAAGSYSTTIAHGAVLNLGKSTTHDFNRRSILNEGTVNWTASDLRGGNGSIFTNNSVFNDLNGGTKSMVLPGQGNGTSTFLNNGTYNKTAGGTTTIEVAFVNNGSIDIAAGSLIFAGAFTNNGQAKFQAPLTFSQDQPLSGSGTIDAPSVTAAGLVSPGSSPGKLTLTGDLSLLGASTLLIELRGRTQGTDYDFLSVGGTASLNGGQLSLSLLNGFGANILVDDSFIILSAATLTGAFSNVANGGRLFMADGVGSFQVNYGLTSKYTALTNSVVLSDFSPIPEPSTYALMGVGAAMVLLVMRRRRS